jgi:hypothetical protein
VLLSFWLRRGVKAHKLLLVFLSAQPLTTLHLVLDQLLVLVEPEFDFDLVETAIVAGRTEKFARIISVCAFICLAKFIEQIDLAG